MATQFPRMARVRQRFEGGRLEDIEGEVRREVARLGLPLPRGARVAITAGSRGIANIARITRAVVDVLKELEASPFIVPAMGSHGGATAEGQRDLLAHLGITQETMGVPIRPSMEVVEVGRTAWGLPAYCGREAAEADGIVIVNRVKPHTSFSGAIESGLTKMLAFGLGKREGAEAAHRAALTEGYQRVLEGVAGILLARLRVLFGLGIVENSREETLLVRACRPGDLRDTDRELLRTARETLPRIPFDFLHLLVVDEMGKEVSGTGMDPNVIGRIMSPPEPEPERPRYLRIFVRDLTPGSDGNAHGMGLADLTTRRLLEKVDFHKTYTNAITAGMIQKARTPAAFATDREAIEVALSMIGLTEPPDARVVRVRNTLRLGEMMVSDSLLGEARAHPRLEVAGPPEPMAFDGEGKLQPPFG